MSSTVLSSFAVSENDSFDTVCMQADDDTYVIMENLRYFLSSHDPNDPVFFGHHFKVIVKPQVCDNMGLEKHMD